jgi:hypothetical protein
MTLNALTTFLALFFLVFGSAFTSIACSPAAWYKDFTNNPATATTSFVTDTLNWLQFATTVFNGLKPLLPAERQPAAQERFDQTSAAIHHGLAVLQDTVDAAAEAQKDKPDLVAATNDVVAAVHQLGELIDAVRVPTSVAHARAIQTVAGTTYTDLKTMQAHLEAHKK